MSRMKLIATGTLAASASVFLGLEIAGASGPLADAAKAAAEAATVGGLADWFAVTALFRRPLGMPVPHTGIIPAHKDRIGASLGQFIEENFVDPDALAAALSEIGFPEKIAAWLEREAGDAAAAKSLSALMVNTLAEADDAALADAVKRELRTLASGSASVDDMRRALIAGMAEQAKERIARDRDKITKALHLYIRRRIPPLEIGPLIVNTRRFAPREATGFVADQLYRQLFDAVSTAADELACRHSRLSREVNATLDEMVSAVADGDAPRGMDDAVAMAWKTLRASLAERVTEAGPGMIRHFAAKMADALRNDAGLREWINGQLSEIARSVVADHRHLVAGHVAEVVAGWTPKSMADTIERHIGRDLQFIRLNGAIVGGLAGLALHFLTLAIRGG